MSLSIRLEGSQDLQTALRRMSDDIKDAVGKEVVATAVELRSDVVKSIQRGPASGRTYKKSNPTRTHTASAPGEPPMSDTGRLANSIEFDKVGPLTATVGSNLDYALWLEYGTASMNFAGGVGGPRPFMRPAVERIKPLFIGRLEGIIKGAAR